MAGLVNKQSSVQIRKRNMATRTKSRKPAALTKLQRSVLDEFWQDICAMISATCHANNAGHLIDDVLDDAITRTISSVVSNGLTEPTDIVSRSRSCALDAIRTVIRQRNNRTRHTAELRAEMTSRHNGESLSIAHLEFTAPLAADFPRRTIARRNFLPELFQAAVTLTTDKLQDGTTFAVPTLQFASYGAEFPE
jgi:hypothetical protein